MTPTPQQIEQASREYANTPPINAKSSEIVGFISGAKWALKKISNLEETGWISVEERLPKIGENVLVFMDYGQIDCCRWDGKYWSQSVRSQHSNGGVTHWQALPKPPTK